MLTRLKFFKVYLVIAALLLVNIPKVYALTEAEKISRLLNAVENSGLVFIRNGNEYNSKKAREHLERKLSYAGSRIKTARQFVEYIATKSSWSGSYYYIRLRNGKMVKSCDWLLGKLEEIEKKKG